MNNSKNIMIVALLIAILSLAVGYAAFATTLNINGHAVVDSNWNVEITNVVAAYNGTAEEVTHSPSYPTHTSTTVSFDTKLKAPGDYATYTVTVKNNGSINAKLNSVTPASFTDLNSASPAIIKYSITSQPALNSVLAPTDEATFVFKVEYESSATLADYQALVTDPPTTIEKSLTATIEYVQDTSSSSGSGGSGSGS